MKRHSLHLLFLGVLISSATLFSVAAEGSTPAQPVNVTGNWQISWEARIATEKGLVRFQQNGTKLTGAYNGPAGVATVAGAVDGKKVSFTLEFSGKYPYSLVFSGGVDDEKMDGKFAVGNMKDGYDSQGENARPTDYSWKATRAGQAGQGANLQTQDTATHTSNSH